MRQPSAVQEQNNYSFFLGENTVETPRLLLAVLNLVTPKRLKRDVVCFGILSLTVNYKEDVSSLQTKMNINTTKQPPLNQCPHHKGLCQSYHRAVLLRIQVAKLKLKL